MRWIWKDDGCYRMHDVDGEEGRVLQFDRPWGGGVHIFHPCRGSFYFPCAIQKRYVKAHEFQHTKILVFGFSFLFFVCDKEWPIIGVNSLHLSY